MSRKLVMKYKDFFGRSTVLFFFLLVFFIPVWVDIAILILPFLLLSAVLSTSWVGFGRRLWGSKCAVLMILFWVLYLVSILYSDDWKYSINDVQQKLLLVVFPLFFVLSSSTVKKYYHKLIDTFALGCVVSIVVCLVTALVHSLSFESGSVTFNPVPTDVPWENYFTYDRLANFYHPSYLSMYLSFGIVIIFNRLKVATSSKEKALYLLLIILFCGFVYLLSSRAGMLVASMSVLIGVIVLLKNWRKVFCITGIGLAVLLCGLWVSYNIKGSFSQRAVDELLYGVGMRQLDYKVQQDSRIGIWKTLPEVIAQKPLFGYGTGDIHQVLNNAYREQGFDYAADNNLNTHNQYFETAIAIGLIGLAVFLTILLLPLISFRRSKDFFLPLAFILIVAANFVFESMVTRITGVLFFAFFYCLFFCSGVLQESDSDR